MKTHVWIIGDLEKQLAPIGTLVLAILRHPGDGEETYLANGIEIPKIQWEQLKEDIEFRATYLSNMARNY